MDRSARTPATSPVSTRSWRSTGARAAARAIRILAPVTVKVVDPASNGALDADAQRREERRGVLPHGRALRHVISGLRER
jgi:hypothetical protein